MSTSITQLTSPRRIFIPNLMGRQMITVNLDSENEEDSTLDLLHFEDAGYASSESDESSASDSGASSPVEQSVRKNRLSGSSFIPADAF